MESTCAQIEEIIWEYARENTRLPDHVREHLATCSKCARLLEETRLLSSLLHQAGQVSRAPDCRAAVMSRIARTNRLLVLRKVFAGAAVLLCLAIIAQIISPQHEARQAHRSVVTTQSKSSAKETPASPSAPTETSNRSTRRVVGLTDNNQNVVTMNIGLAKSKSRRVAVNLPTKHSRPANKIVDPVTPEEESQPSVHDTHSSEQAGRNTDGIPITAIYVTWSEHQDQQKESIYVYVEQDVETGEITTCSVKSSGEKMEIHIESTSTISNYQQGGA
ncbi:MAG: anti-sigma factor family protein [Armatimonadota bacterium]